MLIGLLGPASFDPELLRIFCVPISDKDRAQLYEAYAAVAANVEAHATHWLGL